MRVDAKGGIIDTTMALLESGGSRHPRGPEKRRLRASGIADTRASAPPHGQLKLRPNGASLVVADLVVGDGSAPPHNMAEGSGDADRGSGSAAPARLVSFGNDCSMCNSQRRDLSARLLLESFDAAVVVGHVRPVHWLSEIRRTRLH